jgi:riboflavin biosynthesis pyrimidine reductase
MTQAIGFPHGPFAVLFAQPTALPAYLSPAIRQIYQGDLQPLRHANRPYVFTNFVTSRDGRVSFSVPGHVGGGDVSRFSAADTWLMGMLRSCADAVMIGDGTLRLEPDHILLPEYIYPADQAAFADLRMHLGLAATPIHVFVSLDGQIIPHAACLHQPGLRVVIATTTHGKQHAEAQLQSCKATIDILDLGEPTVDLAALMQILFARYQVRNLLCEGGPRLHGSMLKAGLVDDEFLTLSPIMIGAEPNIFRPSLIEGVTFAPGIMPSATVLSVRKVQELLFLHSRWQYSVTR